MTPATQAGTPRLVMHRTGTSGTDYQESPGQTVDELREVYRLRVPMGRAWFLNPKGAWRIILATYETVAFDGSHAATALDANQITRLLNPNGDAMADAKMVTVALKEDGTLRDVTAVGDHIDGADPGTVTCSDDSEADHQVSYVPHEPGMLTLEVHAALRNQIAMYEVMAQQTRRLFGLNQDRRLSLSAPFWLPEDWSLVFRIDAPWQVRFTDGCTAGANLIPMTAIDIPVFEATPAELPGNLTMTEIEKEALRYCSSGVR